jgi:hypothetical protein
MKAAKMILLCLLVLAGCTGLFGLAFQLIIESMPLTAP